MRIVVCALTHASYDHCYRSEFCRLAGTSATVNATLQNGSTISGGNVAFIENSVDPQTGTILVRALFDNQDEKLWPGTLASVRVSLRTDKNVVAVPSEAVQNGQRGNFVFVIENGAAKVRDITVARTVDGESVVTNGLTGDETVVINGLMRVRPGAKVKPEMVTLPPTAENAGSLK